MPRTKPVPHKMVAAQRDDFAQAFTMGAGAAARRDAALEAQRTAQQQAMLEVRGQLGNMLTTANTDLASRRASPAKKKKKKQVSFKLSKKPVKIASLTKRRSSPKMRTRSPPVQCPAGCIPAPKKTKGQQLEADMLAELEAKAAQYDAAPVTVLNPTTGRFETLDGTPSSPRSPPRTSVGPTGFQEFNRLKREATMRGDESFQYNGSTYVRAAPGSTVWKKDATGASTAATTTKSPCTQFKKDPVACNATPGCSYAQGATKAYCTARSGGKIPTVSKLMPIAPVTLADYVPFGTPQATAVPIGNPLSTAMATFKPDR